MRNLLQGQDTEFHFLDLKLGHDISGAQKQKGVLFDICFCLGTSLEAPRWSPLDRAEGKGGGKAWELGTGLCKSVAEGIRLCG